MGTRTNVKIALKHYNSHQFEQTRNIRMYFIVADYTLLFYIIPRSLVSMNPSFPVFPQIPIFQFFQLFRVPDITNILTFPVFSNSQFSNFQNFSGSVLSFSYLQDFQVFPAFQFFPVFSHSHIPILQFPQIFPDSQMNK